MVNAMSNSLHAASCSIRKAASKATPREKKRRAEARREEMHAYFATLASMVPGIPRDRRLSRVEILQYVIDYIQELEKRLLGGGAERQSSSSSSPLDALASSFGFSPSEQENFEPIDDDDDEDLVDDDESDDDDDLAESDSPMDDDNVVCSLDSKETFSVSSDRLIRFLDAESHAGCFFFFLLQLARVCAVQVDSA